MVRLSTVKEMENISLHNWLLLFELDRSQERGTVLASLSFSKVNQVLSSLLANLERSVNSEEGFSLPMEKRLHFKVLEGLVDSN